MVCKKRHVVKGMQICPICRKFIFFHETVGRAYIKNNYEEQVPFPHEIATQNQRTSLPKNYEKS